MLHAGVLVLMFPFTLVLLRAGVVVCVASLDLNERASGGMYSRLGLMLLRAWAVGFIVLSYDVQASGGM